MRRGRAATFDGITVRTIAMSGAQVQPHVGIITTKKVGGAVERNKLRRRCRAILDAQATALAGLWLIVDCKPEAANASFAALRTALLRALNDSSARARQSGRTSA